VSSTRNKANDEPEEKKPKTNKQPPVITINCWALVLFQSPPAAPTLGRWLLHHREKEEEEEADGGGNESKVLI
jgi:hypothetical protein